MIENIKRIKLKELNVIKQQQMAEHNAESQKLVELRKEDEILKEKELIPIRHFSIFERLLTKRKEYKEYKEQIRLKPQYSKKRSEILQEIEKQIEKIRKNSEDLEDVNTKIIAVRNARTLQELKVKPEEAVQILEKEGVVPTLTEEDKEITYHNRNYESKGDLVLIHKTKYMPTEGMIKTQKDAHVKLQKKVAINGKEYEILMNHERDTVHMSVNDEVSSHSYGNWDDCSYAILIPFEDIPNEKIDGATTVDTFSKGSLILPKSAWILCPVEEVKKVKSCNPEVHVLGYEGKTVQDFSRPFLTQLGYRAESVGSTSWEDRESSSKFYEIMKKEGIKIVQHSTSHNKEDEDILIRMDYIVELSKLLRDKELIKTKEEARDVIKQLEDQHCGFRTMIGNLCEHSCLEEKYYDESAIVANRKQADIFIRKMEKNGFEIEPSYQQVIRKMGQATYIGCDEKNIDDIFTVDSTTPEIEKRNIMKLKEVFIKSKDGSARENAFADFLGEITTDSILKQKNKEQDIQAER